MTIATKDLPPVGSTGTLAELQVGPGDVVKCIESRYYSTKAIYVGDVFTVNENGLVDGPQSTTGAAADWTLISRATPQPPHIVVHEGRTYDLTALETPFGLLPDPVQNALKAWPHGLEVYNCDETGLMGAWVNATFVVWDWHVLRAKPAPVETRVNCARFGHGEPYEYGTCVKRADGSIDWATWEGDE